MKTTLQFTVSIASPRTRVWEVMQGPETYREWTSPFCEGTYYEGSWEKGATIRFLAPNGDGMVAEIAESRSPEHVSIRHLGEIRNGIEDTTSDGVLAWAPAYENYTFVETPDGTQLIVDIDAMTEYEQYMGDTFPKALERLKEICESGR